MNDIDLIQWLRDNSSGVYRPSRDAADRIEQLISENAKLAQRLAEKTEWADQQGREHGERFAAIVKDNERLLAETTKWCEQSKNEQQDRAALRLQVGRLESVNKTLQEEKNEALDMLKTVADERDDLTRKLVHQDGEIRGLKFEDDLEGLKTGVALAVLVKRAETAEREVARLVAESNGHVCGGNCQCKEVSIPYETGLKVLELLEPLEVEGEPNTLEALIGKAIRLLAEKDERIASLESYDFVDGHEMGQA